MAAAGEYFPTRKESLAGAHELYLQSGDEELSVAHIIAAESKLTLKSTPGVKATIGFDRVDAHKNSSGQPSRILQGHSERPSVSRHCSKTALWPAERRLLGRCLTPSGRNSPHCLIVVQSCDSHLHEGESQHSFMAAFLAPEGFREHCFSVQQTKQIRID